MSQIPSSRALPPTRPHGDSRIVELEQMFNARDLGGLPTVDGYCVRSGKVLRSDDPHLAAAGDLEALRELGIDTVIDLRTGEEVSQRGTAAWDDLGVRRTSHPLWSAVPTVEHDHKYLDPRLTAGLYGEMHEQNRATHPNLWRAIADASAGRIAIHCASGRDRTGIVVALLLSFLGVREEAILEDYAMSANGMRRMLEYMESTFPPEKFAQLQLDKEAMVLTPPEAIGNFLTWIRERHDGIDGYATDLGVEDQLPILRKNLLED